jgi:hypothetical protein
MFCLQVCCEVSADAAMAHGSVAPGAARPTAEAIAANRPPPARPTGGGYVAPQRASVTYDPDQYDPDANQRSGLNSGGGGYAAPAPSYGGVGGGAKPSRVVRASDGVVYDPDQYDPDANQRSR